MVPTALVVMEALPLTVNGKLDRKALPAPQVTRQRAGRGPRTPREEALCALIAEVLGLPDVGIDDSFFALGGDSILSLQLVSRARKAGLALTARDVFQHQTVAALASVAGETADAAERVPDGGVGDLVATPITHWLRELGGPFDGFNQSIVLRVPAGLGRHLDAALRTLVDHHDALRTRMSVTPEGQWNLTVPPTGEPAVDRFLRTVDIAGLDADAVNAAVAEHGEAARTRLSPVDGTMLQAVWFDAGEDASGLLLLVAHHLVVDGVSWRVLLPDLRTAWEALAVGDDPLLDPVPTSMRHWSHLLATHAAKPERAAEAALWEDVLDVRERALGSRELDPARDVASARREVSLTLPPEATEPLLTSVPALFHAGANDILLTGLALALAEWQGARGRDADGGVLVDLEGHGREELDDRVDLSRTVGWFTSLYPVRLDLGALGRQATVGSVLEQAVKLVKEQLRVTPDNGIGYGLLRHLNPDTGKRLAELPGPQLGFNYLGRFASATDGASEDWSPAAGVPVPAPMDADMPLPHALEVNATTRDHADGPRLAATWSWPQELFSEAEVLDLAEGWFRALHALAGLAEQAGIGGHTPSDLSLELSQDEIDDLEDELRTWE